MKQIIFLCIVALVSIHVGFSQSGNVSVIKPNSAGFKLAIAGEAKITLPSLALEHGAYATGWITEDRNSDKKIDYAFKVDKKNQKTLEVYDFNFDGFMDDYSTFVDGILSRREIDSNFDKNIDIWLYLYKGTHVQAYEKDKNYDGIIDVVKQY